MKLAAFDLDNTLLAGDSDYLWGQFLVSRGQVDGPSYDAANRRFYEDYQAGVLDIHAFARFSLGQMGHIGTAELLRMRREFVEEVIAPIVAPGAQALIEDHRGRGDTLIIITATNTFITRPIAELLGIENLLGTEPAIENGRMTGEIAGTPCFQEGKLVRLNEWLDGRAVEESWFYSDSVNDVPLMEWADHAFAVDPCPRLRQIAEERRWPILSLRQAS